MGPHPDHVLEVRQDLTQTSLGAVVGGMVGWLALAGGAPACTADTAH